MQAEEIYKAIIKKIENCGSLNNIPTNEESSTRDIIEDLLKFIKKKQIKA